MKTTSGQTRRILITIHAIEFGSADEAIQHTEASGFGEAIMLDGKWLVVDQMTIDKLACTGASFAYLCDHKGQLVTVPVN